MFRSLHIRKTFLASTLALLAGGYAFRRSRFTKRDGARPIAAHDALEARVAQRTHELTMAFEFSQEIVAQLDLPYLLHSVTDRARVLTHAEAASVCLLDEQRQHLVLAASDGSRPLPTGQLQPIWLPPADRVVGAGETVAMPSDCSACGFLQAHSPGQCLAAPLHIGRNTLGELCVVRSGAVPFDADEMHALTLLANSAAIAIANARLIEADRRQAERSAALAERERLAAELHDHLAQTLGFLNLQLDQLNAATADDNVRLTSAELDRIRAIVGQAYAQARDALTGLREPTIETNDLIEKLSACVAEFRETSGLSADIIGADVPGPPLSRLAQAQTALIVREALINVRKHAQALNATVRIERVNGEAIFSVEDDGCGFDPDSATEAGHLGLTIMRTRAERLGGRLSIESAPGAGTRIVARFPLSEAR